MSFAHKVGDTVRYEGQNWIVVAAYADNNPWPYADHSPWYKIERRDIAVTLVHPSITQVKVQESRLQPATRFKVGDRVVDCDYPHSVWLVKHLSAKGNSMHLTRFSGEGGPSEIFRKINDPDMSMAPPAAPTCTTSRSECITGGVTAADMIPVNVHRTCTTSRIDMLFQAGVSDAQLGAPPFKVGDRVVWSCNRGTVVTVGDGFLWVLRDERDSSYWSRYCTVKISSARLEPKPEPRKVRVGDNVVAVWSGRNTHPATVRAINGDMAWIEHHIGQYSTIRLDQLKFI